MSANIKIKIPSTVTSLESTRSKEKKKVKNVMLQQADNASHGKKRQSSCCPQPFQSVYLHYRRSLNIKLKRLFSTSGFRKSLRLLRRRKRFYDSLQPPVRENMKEMTHTQWMVLKSAEAGAAWNDREYSYDFNDGNHNLTGTHADKEGPNRDR